MGCCSAGEPCPPPAASREPVTSASSGCPSWRLLGWTRGSGRARVGDTEGGMGPGTAGRWEAGGPGPPVPAQPLTLSGRLRRNHRIDAGHQAGEEVLEEEQGVLPGKAQVSEAQRQWGPPQALPLTGLLTWSTLSRRGISETRRQHSGPPRLVVGATCRALMVSWGQRASSGYSPGPWAPASTLCPHRGLPEPRHPPRLSNTLVAGGGNRYHVGVGATWQPLARVQVQELVDLGRGETVSDLQLLHDEHLAGQWPLL